MVMNSSVLQKRSLILSTVQRRNLGCRTMAHAAAATAVIASSPGIAILRTKDPKKGAATKHEDGSDKITTHSLIVWKREIRRVKERGQGITLPPPPLSAVLIIPISWIF